MDVMVATWVPSVFSMGIASVRDQDSGRMSAGAWE